MPPVELGETEAAAAVELAAVEVVGSLPSPRADEVALTTPGVGDTVAFMIGG